MLTKTSILTFFLLIAKDEPLFRWCNYLTLAVVNVAGLALTLLNILQCRPVSAGFIYPTPQSANCIDIVTLYLSSAPVNIITDLAILFLPMPTLTSMRLPRKQKIILVFTFSLFMFVTVVDIVRIAYLENAALARLKVAGTKSGNSRIIEQTDFPWYASLSFMWSAVEVNLGIACACVPSLKPLFLRFLPGFIKDADDMSMKGGSFDAGVQARGSLPDFSDKGNTILTNPAALRQSSAAEYRGGSGDNDLGFLDFLTGPMEDNAVARTATAHSRMSRVQTHKTAATNFDFYSMNKSRSMLDLSNRQSFAPVAIVTVVFFLWGFAYGLLSVLNGQFEIIVRLSESQSLGLHAAYYGGYFIGPLTLGRFMLKKYGFKAAMITGLCVYSCGTFVFWPAAVLTSYTAFVVSNFIVGVGLSCLEIAANPFTALCGPLEYAEVRLNISQGFQAIGTVVSPLLAQKVFFKNVLDAPSLVNAQWAYLGIALFDVLLALALYYISLPEASDDDLQDLADRRSGVYRTQVGRVPVVWLTLGLGVLSLFCYVGGQEAIGDNTEAMARLLVPRSKSNSLLPFDYITIGHTVFAVGRFLTAFLNYLFKPRWILLFLYIGLIVTCALQMVLGGNAGISMTMLTYLFESGVFSIVYAIALRGMGSHTKTASAFLAAAISGGTLFSPIQTVVANGHGLQYSFCVPLAAFAFGMIFAIYLNIVPAARNQVDPLHERKHRRHNHRLSFHRTSTASDANSPKNQFGLAGILARRKTQNAEMGSARHVERRSEVSTSSSSAAPSSANEKVEIQKSFSPIRAAHHEPDRVQDFAMATERSHEDERLRAIRHDLGPWPDEADTDKECEILFGKSIAKAI